MVAHYVVVPLLGEEFDGEATDIANGIGAAFLAAGGA